MESLRTALAGILLLFSLASAQYVAKPEPSCKQDLSGGGSDYLSHQTYCQMFYRCVADQKYNFTCGGDAVFNIVTSVCDYPKSTLCENWPCAAANNNTNYPHVCGDKYYTCNGMMGYVVNTCAAGQRFDIATGGCVAGTPVDQPSCSRAVRNDSATCYHQPDTYGDVCKFQTVDGNITHMERSCPDQLAFNLSSCGCTTPNMNCPKPTNNRGNKLPDNECRASMLLTYELFFNGTGALQAYSNKISMKLNDSFQITGVTFNNGIATLSSTGDTKAQIYWYYLNSNELTRITAFVITFRFSGPTTTPVVLFTNNYNEACIPTFNVTATLTGTTYTVTVSATFMTRNSMSNITYTMDSVTASLSVGAANSFLKVTAFHDSVLRLEVADKGATGTTTGQVATKEGTVNLGTTSTWAYNKCGLTIARGLTGDIAETAVHEGCRDVTKLMNK